MVLWPWYRRIWWIWNISWLWRIWWWYVWWLGQYGGYEPVNYDKPYNGGCGKGDGTICVSKGHGTILFKSNNNFFIVNIFVFVYNAFVIL